MKVTFPHMGNLSIVGRGLLEYLGLEVVVPPPITKKTLRLGIEHGHEFACLPLKINLGNFIEAAELGADTIVMTGGVGPCRFGYYAEVEREILEDLGYNYQIIVMEPPDTHFSELMHKIKYLANGKSLLQVAKGINFAWAKAKATDLVEQKVQQVRPREIKQGATDQLYRQILAKIDETHDIKKVLQIQNRGIEELEEIPQDKEKEVLKIAIIGEIYTILEPYVNLHIEEHLGRLGVEVSRSIYLSEWVNEHLFFSLGKMRSGRDTRKLATPYLKHFIGGHGQETVGSAVDYAQLGFQGIIHLAPLTCMPEIVAQSILPLVSKDKSIPIMTIYFDEQSGEAGLLTRLEAFIDLIKRKTAKKKEYIS